LGASDYLTKPQGAGSVEETRRRIQQELIPKLKVLCRRTWFNTATSLNTGVGSVEKPAIPRVSIPNGRIDLVAIGTSTGGPNALAVVLPRIPKDFPVPIVIVQHMPPLFTRLLAERLQKESALKIREGQAGAVLKAGEAWIAPGDFHMVVNRVEKEVKLTLNQEPPENSCRPAVDVLFRSVARTYGANALGVVLTGMGSDGVVGTKAMKAAGAQIVVQDEATSVVWGMPGQVAAAGAADGIYPLEEIAAELQRRTAKSLWFQERKGNSCHESMEADNVRQGTSANSLFAGRQRQ
jgi:two-component system chemotaxis response regulator CheB